MILPIPPIDPKIKEWAQVLFWAVAIIGGLIAAFRAIYEVQQNRSQRIKELRWRRANAAKDILGELFSHELAKNAALMLDWNLSQREYELAKEERRAISYDDVIPALGKNQPQNLDIKEIYIRDSFDYFFYYIDRIEHYIRIRLIKFTDVSAPLKRYANKIEAQEELFAGFMKSQGYHLAIAFFKRYKEKEDAARHRTGTHPTAR